MMLQRKVGAAGSGADAGGHQEGEVMAHALKESNKGQWDAIILVYGCS